MFQQLGIIYGELVTFMPEMVPKSTEFLKESIKRIQDFTLNKNNAPDF